MADTNTTLYGFVKPEVGASADTWGSKLNQGFDDLDALMGATVTAGSANAYTLTTGLSLASLVNGQSFVVKWSFANTGAATLNVDGLGAVALTRNGTTALASGDNVSGDYARVVYDSTGPRFRIVSAGVMDADLAAIAALGYTSGSYIIVKTAADTWSLQTVTAAGLALLDDADNSAQRTTLALGTAATQNTGTSGATVPLLNAANTASDTFTVNKAAGGASQITIGGSNAQDSTLVLNTNAGQARSISFRTAGTNRAIFNLNNTAESGANAGSDPRFSTYDDAGTLLRVDLSITRSNGNWAIAGTSVTIGGTQAYRASSTDVALADGGTGASLADPNADRIMFWDDSAGAVGWLAAGSGLVITTTTMAVDFATTAQIRNNTADKVVGTDEAWASIDTVALTDAATIAVDMSAGINFTVTLGGNRTLGQPTNTKVGQSGFVRVVQDGTGSRTLAYHADWKFDGGTDPVLSTAAGTTDILFYQVIAANFIYASLAKGVA